MPESSITEQEKQEAEELLNELNELGSEGLVDWNIRAETLLLFIAMKNPDCIFEANP